jgi:hypothetical protein
MKNFFAFIVISVVLVLGLGCGGGSNSTSNSGGGNSSPMFSNSSLNGTYLLSVASVAYPPWGGTLALDGRGAVTSGSLDTLNGTFSVTGTYSIAADGTGTMELSGNLSGIVVQQSYHLAISTGEVVQITQTLPAWMKGTLQKLSSATYSLASLNGAYSAYLMDERYAIVARMNMDGAGNITGGEVDGNVLAPSASPTWADLPAASLKQNRFHASPTLRLSSAPQATFIGSYTMAENGRGTMTVNLFGSLMRFAFYAIDSTTLKIVEIDGQAALMGEIHRQPANITAASITGNYILSGMGWMPGGPQAQVARLVADGNGNITSASMDVNAAGTVVSSAFTGTYTVSSSGRGELQLLSATVAPRSYVFYVGAGNRLMLMENDSNGVLGGIAEPQSSATYSNSSANGVYATLMYINYNGFYPDLAVGKIAFNGSGSISGSMNFVELTGTETNGVPVSGSYSVDGTGRGTGTITLGSGTATITAKVNFYMVSADSIRVVITETDINQLFVGIATAQRQH